MNRFTPSRNPLDGILSPKLKFSEKYRKRADLLSRKVKTSGCSSCKLAEERSGEPPVPGEGGGRIFFIGHRIGRQEANNTKPAFGRYSQKGWRLMMDAFAPGHRIGNRQSREAALEYSWVTNVARCGPYVENISKTPRRRCSESWLQQELRALDPAIIVFWHRKAMEVVTDEKLPIGQVKEIRSPLFRGTRPAMLMRHPVRAGHEPELEESIRSDFRQVKHYLTEKGLAEGEKRPDETDHRLIWRESQLQEVWDDLVGKEWLAADTETANHVSFGSASKREAKMGALQWYHRDFEMTCAQVCGLSDRGEQVDRTYTLACGFRDMAGNPRQELTPRQVGEFLYALFKEKSSEGKPKQIATLNSLYDAPVLTRFGCDLWGMTEPNQNFQVHDAMLYESRTNEHLGRKANTTSLDALAQKYLGESKGSFDDYFDVSRFAYTDIHDPEEREKLLKYTGEDPRKTLLVVRSSIRETYEHARETAHATTRSPSIVPEIGTGPFEKGKKSKSRLISTALPIDHQMIGAIGPMELVGYELRKEDVQKAKKWFDSALRSVKKEINTREPGFNPNSAPDTLAVVERALSEVDSRIAGHPKENTLKECFEIESTAKAAFEKAWGELDAQKKTVQDKVLVYLEVSYRRAAEEVEDWTEKPVDELKEFFDLVYAHKQIDKRWGTYFERFLELRSRWGIVHARYWLTRTVSGRLSGNFQNVPTGEDDGEILEVIEPYVHAGEAMMDVREPCRVVQPEGLNRLFKVMNLRAPQGMLRKSEAKRYPKGKPWHVSGGEQVDVLADYAQMEDRMAFVQTGDETKARLLSDASIDTHYHNSAFVFGDRHGFDTSTEEGIAKARDHFSSNPGKFKSMYRSPMKNVHYGSQYGAGAAKLHTLILPIMKRSGIAWNLEDTEEIKRKYDELYAGVTQFREKILEGLKRKPLVEYPIFGALRHAREDLNSELLDGDPLSVANAYNQGTCAYLCKLAMLRFQTLKWMNARRWNLCQVGGDNYVGLNLQVHDEIGVTCPKKLAYEVSLALESAMKMVLAPGNAAHWESETEDYRGETGYLCLCDEAFKAKAIFDADAEVKRTVSKKKVLSNGEKNLLATLEEPSSMKGMKETPNPQFDLVLAKEGKTNVLF